MPGSWRRTIGVRVRIERRDPIEERRAVKAEALKASASADDVRSMC